MAKRWIEFRFVDPDEIRARVAGRIREIAARRKMTLTAFAEQAGVSRSHLYTVLDGSVRQPRTC